jgi:D-alanyl-lipoteichoic acid acyltransferase DltB (MBOAT superfamily)
MLFHSVTFILGFLPVCLAGFFLLGRIAGGAWPLAWLLGMSLVFYGWWNPALLPLLAGSILGNWALCRRIAGAGPRAGRRWLIGGIAANLLVLGWFKYAGFAWGIVAPDQPAPDIVLPLAISFFTFQQIMALADSRAAGVATEPLPSMTVGARHGGAMTDLPTPTAHAPPRLLSHAAFVAFFPHLIAGPLVRPREVIPQLEATDLATPRAANLTAGLTIFLLGLAKKLVLADPFGRFADTGFDAAARGEALTLFEAWYALLAYALQIYFDFSGYSDMAIGLARMLNVRFPLNFDSPYQARTIADFWRRWHITLGQFLRDYVYIPLGGSRSGLGRQVGALLVTMLLCGLWHGAAWRFVLWGAVHGVLLVIHAVWRRLGPPLPAALAHALTLVCVILAWVPFRAADLPTSGAFLLALCGANGIVLPTMIIGFIPPLGWIADAEPVLRFLGDARTLSFPEVTACLILGWACVLIPPHLHTWSDRARAWALTAGFAFTVQALFFAPSVAPFLYFQF